MLGHAHCKDGSPIILSEKAPKVTIRTAVLEKANEYVSIDRQSDHGNPENTFAIHAELWSAYLNALQGSTCIKLRSEDVAAMMVLFKVGRVSQNIRHADTWIDIAGYAACGAELAGVAL